MRYAVVGGLKVDFFQTNGPQPTFHPCRDGVNDAPAESPSGLRVVFLVEFAAFES
jgi:hypothetical protein